MKYKVGDRLLNMYQGNATAIHTITKIDGGLYYYDFSYLNSMGLKSSSSFRIRFFDSLSYINLIMDGNDILKELLDKP